MCFSHGKLLGSASILTWIVALSTATSNRVCRNHLFSFHINCFKLLHYSHENFIILTRDSLLFTLFSSVSSVYFSFFCVCVFGFQSLKEGLSVQERMKLFESFWSKEDETASSQSKAAVWSIKMMYFYLLCVTSVVTRVILCVTVFCCKRLICCCLIWC